MTSTMSSQERLLTVLRGGVPDRVPCIPLVCYFAAAYAGTPYDEFTTSMKTYRRAMDKCFAEVGPWDAMYPLPITMDAPEYEIVFGGGVGMKPAPRQDGNEAAQTFQFTESGGLMREGDYRRIARTSSGMKEYPYLKFLELMISRAAERKRGGEFWARYMLPHLARFGAKWATEVFRWRMRRVPFFLGFSLEAPFDSFSMARGIEDFCVDLMRNGDELEEAAMTLSRSYASVARRVCKVVGIKNFLLLTHRSSNDFISPAHYRRFAHPGIKFIAEELAKDGIVMGLHADGNWDMNFEFMTDLPKNTYVQLDGYSDAALARRVLGNDFTIMGDVPPDILAFGSVDDVEERCIKLIKEVGRDGHFILSSGCEVPPNAKPENVRAMIDAARTHGSYN